MLSPADNLFFQIKKNIYLKLLCYSSLMSKEIIFYYLTSFDTCACVNTSNNDIKIRPYEEIRGLIHFEAFESYTQDEAGLLQFKADMIRMNKDLNSVLIRSKSGKPFRIKYFDSKSHTGAVVKRFADCNLNKGLKMGPETKMSSEEFYFHEKSNGSGLMVLNMDYKGVFVNGYGYDYSRFYPHLLCDKEFKFPLKPGTAKRFKKVNFSKLRFGLYNVKVTCTDPRFLSMFRYNLKNYYDNETLIYLNEIKDEYGIELELICLEDGSANAYVYDEVETGHDHFGQWFAEMEHVRIELEERKIKCGLVKYLMSSLWGRLTAFENQYLDYDECSKLKGISHRLSDRETKYKIIDIQVDKNRIIDTENAYKYKFGRMKVFLTAFGRLKMLKLCHFINMNTNSKCEIVRIHTDGIILNKPFDMKSSKCLWDKSIHAVYYPKEDEKITGEIMFNDVNYQHRKCKKCGDVYKVYGGSVDYCLSCV